MKSQIESLFRDNIQRVRALSQHYVQLAAPSGQLAAQNSMISEDVLRASIVLLHATFEEFMRGITLWKLPDRGPEELTKIPLLKHSEHNRAQKFSLAELHEFKSYTIEKLIVESIEDHLNTRSYNSIEDIVTFLNSLGFEKAPLEHLFPGIAKLIAKRHLIVHNADRNRDSEDGLAPLLPVGYSEFLDWLSNVEDFAGIMLAKY